MARKPRSLTGDIPLPLSAIDFYLCGWDGVDVHVARAAGIDEAQYDWLWPFTTPDSELRELWQVHRDSLMREADRRGIRKPWGAIEFDNQETDHQGDSHGDE